jgi:hypothetical protein
MTYKKDKNDTPSKPAVIEEDVNPQYPRSMLSQVCWFMSAGGGG